MNKLDYLRRAIRCLIEGPDYSAGVVVMRRFADGLRVLCIMDGESPDIPKGGVEPDDKDILSTALRELSEEAGITAIEFPWGHDTVTAGHITAFVGLTEQDVMIRPNPETGVTEHTSFKWVPIVKAPDFFSGDLGHIVSWATCYVSNTYKK